MFYCERCESSFNETVAAVAGKCPRCLSEDGTSVPIRYRPFDPKAPRISGSTQKQVETKQCIESP